MRPLFLALAALSAQGTIAWDTRDGSGKWWKQDTTPIKHKHHKHYRHHHHRTQLCEPVDATTSQTNSFLFGSPQATEIAIPVDDDFEEGLPPNIAGDLTSRGADCGTSLTTLAVSEL